jgi:hypothetical protein
MEYSQNRKEFIEKFKQQSQNNTINESRLSNNNDYKFDGRWDYLHQLSKVKKTKHEQIRKIVKQDELEKEMKECTFNPRLNKTQFSSNIMHGSNGEHFDASNNINNKSQHNFSYHSVLERQDNWANKKNIKLETIKNEQFIKEFGQCYFSPKIVINILIN